LGRPVGANSDETRHRIIDATMRCVAEVGYSRATIRQIAQAAQMTSGSLYHYYPTKADLVTAAAEELEALINPRLLNAADEHTEFLDKLMAVFDETDRIKQEFPYLTAFDRALRVGGRGRLELTTDSEAVFTAMRDIFVSIIEQAREAGALDPATDVAGASDALYIVFQGLADYAVTATPAEYHCAIGALKSLIAGTLFAPQQTTRTAPSGRSRAKPRR